MSAFVVGTDHIDAMLTAGLTLARPYGPMRWYLPEPPGPACYQEGEPWGPAAGAWAREYRRELTKETANEVGAMLLLENLHSVNHRYTEAEAPPAYRFRPLPGHPDPVVVLKAIDCYEYQSCEHPGWKTSEAYAFCDALRRTCIASLAGYDTAPGWEVRSRDVFVTSLRKTA